MPARGLAIAAATVGGRVGDVVLWGGLDPGGQAGLAADLQVVARRQARARLVLTARTAQADGTWRGAWPVPIEELRTVVAGLDLPQRFAVKAGMLATLPIARELLAFLREHPMPLVVDPLHRSTSGAWMWPGEDEAEVRRFLREELLPSAAVVTPNWPELEWLAGQRLEDLHQAQQAARTLPCAVVLKGGHAPEPWRGQDHAWDGVQWTTLEPVAQPGETWRMRGTGCRFATDLALTLGAGKVALAEAARQAKATVAALVQDARRAQESRQVQGL